MFYISYGPFCWSLYLHVKPIAALDLTKPRNITLSANDKGYK